MQRSVLESVIRSSSLLISILALSSGCHGGSEGSEPASLSKDKSPIKFTVVGGSDNLAIHASGARHLFINVTTSEAPKSDFTRFSRYCLIEDWNPLTALRFGGDSHFQVESFKPNRTYFCYESVSQLRQRHSYLVWTGDHGIRKGAPVPAEPQTSDFTHTVFKFDCSGVRNRFGQHTCEVLPTKPGGNRQCFDADGATYSWGGVLGSFVCLGGWSLLPGLKVSDLRGCINSRGEPTHSGRDGFFVCSNSRWVYDPR